MAGMSYQIQPRKLSFEPGEWMLSWFWPGNLGCSGCASGLIALIVLFWAASQNFWSSSATADHFLRFVGLSALLYLVATLVVYIVRKKQRNRSEAARATSDAMTILNGVREHSNYLTYRARTVADALKTAAFELEQEAFAPFWDAIEAAAAALGECHASSEWISTGVPRYDAILHEREHDFPDCFDGIEALPDCRPLLDELYRLVRLAQRDFRFANIWELRQTRKVLIAGFATLGEAIKSLEETVQRSIADLKKTIEARTLIPLPPGSPGRTVLRMVVPFP
jgi:hypothetical protein